VKNSDPIPVKVTAALIHRADGRFLLARRSPGQKMAGRWELPGGKVEKGETPEQCMARELEEELGIEVKVGAFLGSINHEYAWGKMELMAYEVEMPRTALKLSVHDQIKWVLPGEVVLSELVEADVKLLARLDLANRPDH